MLEITQETESPLDQMKNKLYFRSLKPIEKQKAKSRTSWYCSVSTEVSKENTLL